MRWVAALLLAVALAVQPGVAWAAGRVALVVGVSTYANVASLNNPARDAARVAEALRAADFDVTTLTLPQQVTRASLVSALAKFRARADNAEAAVIYFAGHGVEVDGSNWLLPADVAAESPDDLEGTAIRASFAVNAVRGASKIRLVILDACRNNPFERTRGWAAGKRAIGTRGLGREADRADNVVLLLATQPGTTANDGNGAANSPFALALATSLGTDGMQIAALPATVARQMRQLTGVDQRPDQQGIFDEPSWTFHGGGGSATAGIATAEPVDTAPQTEALLYQGALAANSKAAFDDYLGRYPNGSFAAVARANLERLNQHLAVEGMTRQPSVRDNMPTEGGMQLGHIGITVQPMTPAIAAAMKLTNNQGVFVTNVVPGQVADKAGVRPRDVVIAVDLQHVMSVETLSSLMAAKAPGSLVWLDLIRDGKPIALSMVTVLRPSD